MSQAFNLIIVFAFALLAIIHMLDDATVGMIYLIAAKLWLMDIPD